MDFSKIKELKFRMIQIQRPLLENILRKRSYYLSIICRRVDK